MILNEPPDLQNVIWIDEIYFSRDATDFDVSYEEESH